MSGRMQGTRSSRGLGENAAKANDFVRFMRLVHINADFSGCWVWAGNIPDGRYGHFSVRRRTVKAHRWIYETVVGPIPAGQLLRHKCDNPCCVNPAHLEPGTASDNMIDMVQRGRNPNRQGERHPLSKMTETSVRELRALAARGVTHSMLSEKYGIARGQVAKIIHRKNWGHVL